MAQFIVKGGQPLEGAINLAGAKNAATKMLVASLLTEEESVFENFPQIGDTEITAELCRLIGSNVEIKHNKAVIRTPEIKNAKVLQLSRRNRIPILAFGPLLSRVGEAEIPVPGGDKIGPRPVDIHFDALKKLGAEIEIGDTFYRVKTKGLKGADISFRYPSVGATENTILAAVTAEGKTKIKNAAIEPEIIDLIKFLQKMGAIIEMGTNRRIAIEGVKELHGACHKIIPDRNEAVSFASLAIATNGDVLIKGADQDHLITFLNAVRRVGANYEVQNSGIRFWREGDLSNAAIETDTHPGFMTDWQQPFAIVLTQGKGKSVIHETIYEDRFGYTEDLNKMGANIKISTGCPEDVSCRFKDKGFKHTAFIYGPTPLHGENIRVRDIRAGIAHLIAALSAEGASVVEGIEEIDRGYENVDDRLRQLGAKIERLE